MANSPMVEMLDDLISKLKVVVIARAEAEKQFSHYTNAIKALIPLCEDEEARAEYLNMLDELSGKPGFLYAVRNVLRSRNEALTPYNIRFFITMGKKLDLTQYSNPMASIHTTLRRMKQSGEGEEIVNDKGEKTYRIKVETAAGRMTPPPTLEKAKEAAMKALGTPPAPRRKINPI